MVQYNHSGTDKPDGMAATWKSFYDTYEPDLGVMRLESREYVHRLERLGLISEDATVLDFGCGAGFIAQMLAPKVKQVFLWDASAPMRRFALSHTAQCPNVTLLDLSDPRGPEPGQACDIILVNSVIQYMEWDPLTLWMSRWRQLLRKRGHVIISDIVTPDVNPYRDLADMMRFWLRNRMFSAFADLVPRLIRYRSVHQSRPLLKVELDALARISEAAGFRVEVQRENLTHFRTRKTVIFSV